MANATAGLICQGGFLEEAASALSTGERVEWKGVGQGRLGAWNPRSGDKPVKHKASDHQAKAEFCRGQWHRGWKGWNGPIREGFTCQGKEPGLCSAGNVEPIMPK